MSKDIKVTDGVILESLNSKIDCDGGNYPGSGLEEYINTHNVGLTLFDPVIKDHVLTYPEGKGLALQGTYVYKNAVAGERYGYPDFYNKCLEEYKNSQVTANVPNVNITGTLECVNGILSGFNASARADVPTEFDPSSYSWEMVFKVKTGSDITTNNDIASGYDYAFVIRINSGKLRLYLSTDGTSWNLASGIDGTYALSTNTEYYVKLEFTGTNYILSISTNGIEYTQDINVAGTGLITPRIMTIGCRATTSGISVPFLGSIDLNESYININGERWWNGGLLYKNSNGHVFYNIADKQLVDDIFASTGMAWMYGIDQANERIFVITGLSNSEILRMLVKLSRQDCQISLVKLGEIIADYWGHSILVGL